MGAVVAGGGGALAGRWRGDHPVGGIEAISGGNRTCYLITAGTGLTCRHDVALLDQLSDQTLHCPSSHVWVLHQYFCQRQSALVALYGMQKLRSGAGNHGKFGAVLGK